MAESYEEFVRRMAAVAAEDGDERQTFAQAFNNAHYGVDEPTEEQVQEHLDGKGEG